MFRNDNQSKRRFHPLKVLFFILVLVVFVLALGWLVMFLWNAILPEAVGVKPLNFWQAVGLLVLSKILFGGLGRFGRKGWGPGAAKRKHWRNKWRNMSAEERAEMKARWKERCAKKSNKDNS